VVLQQERRIFFSLVNKSESRDTPMMGVRSNRGVISRGLPTMIGTVHVSAGTNETLGCTLNSNVGNTN
jgi:hypothetical protein